MQSVVDNIAGYTYGANDLATSPVTMKDLDLLKQTITLDPEDARYLAGRHQFYAASFLLLQRCKWQYK
jgi:hypothetical protein